MMKEIKRPFNAQKALRVACLVLADLILINLSAILALYIRFEFDFRQLYATTFLRDMLIYAGINSACTILIFHILKLYNSLWEFAGVSELVRITLVDSFHKCCSVLHDEDRKSTRLNSSHKTESRMPSSA